MKELRERLDPGNEKMEIDKEADKEGGSCDGLHP